eukprot:5943805-Pyramimonas_sp.AAC.1
MGSIRKLAHLLELTHSGETVCLARAALGNSNSPLLPLFKIADCLNDCTHFVPKPLAVAFQAGGAGSGAEILQRATVLYAQELGRPTISRHPADPGGPQVAEWSGAVRVLLGPDACNRWHVAWKEARLNEALPRTCASADSWPSYVEPTCQVACRLPVSAALELQGAGVFFRSLSGGPALPGCLALWF